MGWFSRKPALDPLAERAAADNVLFHASGVRIRASAKDFRIPGHNKVSQAVRLHRGSVVVTADRLAVTFKKFMAIDGALRDDPAAPAQVSYDADGVHVTIDITRALQGVPGKNSGTVFVNVLAPIPPDVLTVLVPSSVSIGTAQLSALTRRI